VKVRVPDDPAARFPAVVAAAEADPVAAAAFCRHRIVEAIETLHTLVFGSQPRDSAAAMSKLQHDGYMDASLRELADRLLGTSRTTAPETLTVAASTALADATQKFLGSLGRTASLAFERQVGFALQAIPGATVESRPVKRQGRAPDFVVKLDGRAVIIEAYLPARPSAAHLQRRIADRKPLVGDYGASELVVVLPDGTPEEEMRVPLDEDVRVTRLGDVAAVLQQAPQTS
jgi:hypothetical protein